MSEMGQSGRFRDAPKESGCLPVTDIRRQRLSPSLKVFGYALRVLYRLKKCLCQILNHSLIGGYSVFKRNGRSFLNRYHCRGETKLDRKA